MFINGHKQSDFIKDCKNFLKKIEELKTYIVKFEKNGIMKAKIYFFNCKVEKPN